MMELITPTHDISADGRTVWVNGADGMCIGRFSKWGIDVHLDATGQLESGKQCLACTHTRPEPEDWIRFQELMQLHYGIQVEDRFKPEFLR